MGVSLHEWEHMTPAELMLLADEWQKQLDEGDKADRAKIYALAALVRVMVHAKHPPEYSDVFPEGAKPEELTDEQLFEKVKNLNALFGRKEA